MPHTADPLEPSARRPFWLRAERYITRAILWLCIAAMVTEAVVIVIDGGPWLGLAGAVVALAGAVLATRRPWLGLMLTWVGVAVTVAGGRDSIAESSVVVFTVFGLTARGLPAFRPTAASGLALALVFGVASIITSGRAVALDAVAVIVAVVAAGAVGSALYLQGRYWEALEQRTRDAVATREAEAERRVADERLRIARDLHDIVGHHVAVISMHLGALEVTAGRDPDAASRSLAAAREAVQAVLSETHGTLNLLRNPGEASDADELQPTPGLSTIPALVASFRTMGLTLDDQIDHTDAATGNVGVTAYRIVQEALTNAHRYGTGEAALTIRSERRALLITVANPVGAAGQSGVSEGSGFGLTGMRERVDVAGGRMTVTDSDGVFTVDVSLPLNERVTS